MLLAEKVVSRLLTIQNEFIRLDFGKGVGFNWSGLCSIERKGLDARMALDIRSMWEIVCVRPTRNLGTEHFKTITSAAAEASLTVAEGEPSEATTVPATTIPEDESLPAGAIRAELTWSDVLVDEEGADKLTVVVGIELRQDEAFARFRISAKWSENGSPSGEAPGRYAIWKVRFPVLEFAPLPDQVPGDESLEDGPGDDYLFVPDNHGMVIRSPCQAASGDETLGVFEPWDRSDEIRDEPSPGSSWRQSYPGKASTQAAGYYGHGGRGVLIGCLDRLSHLKELAASGQEGSVRIEVVQIPEWGYSIGNRPNGFTGSVEGDNQDAFDALPSHLPQSGIIEEAPDLLIPDARSIDAGPPQEAGDHVASAGFGRAGFLWMGTVGENLNTSLSLGYDSPYDVAVMPMRCLGGAAGWQSLASAWREIAELPDGAFPLIEERNAAALHPASEAVAALDIDLTVHDGQESVFGMDEAGFPAAYAAKSGVSDDLSGLIHPAVMVESREMTSDQPVAAAGADPVVSGEVLDSSGARAGIRNYGGTRGSIRLFGKDGFYVAPKQIPNGYLQSSTQVEGLLEFVDFSAIESGVKPGDIVRIISRSGHGDGGWPLFGRSRLPAAGSSEAPPVPAGDDVRLVIAVPDDGSLVIGRRVAGSLSAWGFSPSLTNSPGRFFEAEILRREVNALVVDARDLGAGRVRAEVNLPPEAFSFYLPDGNAAWAQEAVIDGSSLRVRSFRSELVPAPIGQAFAAVLELDGTVAAVAGKAVRIRSKVEPVDFAQLGADGKLLELTGSRLNEPFRLISFLPGEAAASDMSDGILRFDLPLVPEDGEFGFVLHDVPSSDGRVLGPLDDIAGAGRRFIDDGYSVAVQGGFRKTVAPGDLLIFEGALEEGNEGPFEIKEVLDERSFAVDRDFVSEDSLNYRVIRRGRVLRDVLSVRSLERDFAAGTHRLVPGSDRVHVLAIGWLLDASAPITGTFGVDSLSWADLGANPFVPAESVNVTEYERSRRGTRKADREFVVESLSGSSDIILKTGWDLEDSSFAVTFDDIGEVTFSKNVLQYRIVRDDRAVAAEHQMEGATRAIKDWAAVLGKDPFLAFRGWQPKIVGFDEPDFPPPRGRFLEFLKAFSHPAAAIDAAALKADDEDGLYESLDLLAAAFFNRFGTASFPVPPGDSATPLVDGFFDPSVLHGRTALLGLLRALRASGMKDFLFEQVEEAVRSCFGSPHFQKDGSFEVLRNGGGPGWSEGWRSFLIAIGGDASMSQPMDWLAGLVGASFGDWFLIRKSIPVSDIPFPVGGQNVNSMDDCSMDGGGFIAPFEFDQQSSILYGMERFILPGDALELLPSGRIFVISDVGTSLLLEEDGEIGEDDSWRIRMRQPVAREMAGPVPFFAFAFGAYLSVAADATFLLNDRLWEEASARFLAGDITEAAYVAAVEDAYRLAMSRTALACINGMLPLFRVRSEAARMVPVSGLGIDFAAHGSSSMVAQRLSLLTFEGVRRQLVAEHLFYVQGLVRALSGWEGWTRFGSQAPSPSVAGATSLQVPGEGPGASSPVVHAAAFTDVVGDVLMLLSDWATLAAGGRAVEAVVASWSYSDLGKSSGYWAAVSGGLWLGWVDDVSDDPPMARDQDVSILPLETKTVLLYEQRVIIRADADDEEVDRVLPVRAGRSVAAALAVVALDVLKGGSGSYKIVVSEGALEPGLDIPTIPGAIIEIQNAGDETPEIQ